MVSCVEKWRCPYCHTMFDKEYDAKDCAVSCAPIDDPEMVSKIICDMCAEVCNNEQEASECEIQHAKFEDRYYRAHILKMNFEGLEKAAKHPAQMRLGEVAMQYLGLTEKRNRKPGENMCSGLGQQPWE